MGLNIADLQRACLIALQQHLAFPRPANPGPGDQLHSPVCRPLEDHVLLDFDQTCIYTHEEHPGCTCCARTLCINLGRHSAVPDEERDVPVKVIQLCHPSG